MAKTRTMTRNRNHDDDDDASSSSSTKRPKSCASWSDLNHDLVNIVMMKLGFGDYYSFRGVCKSWRSLACSNENMVMASMPPMSISISSDAHEHKACHLEDFKGRKFKTFLPHSAAGECVGLTCGYLIFFRQTNRDFWLVNPITRDLLHFRVFPRSFNNTLGDRAILVFSTSVHGWVFVVTYRLKSEIWFSIASKGAWNHVLYTGGFFDLCFFKGKIYTLKDNTLCELRLNPEPKMTYLEVKNFPDPGFIVPELVSSCENLYVIDQVFKILFHELDFTEMRWVSLEKRMDEYAIFNSKMNHHFAVIPDSLADPQSYRRYVDTDNYGKYRFFTTNMWYFPHECMKVDRIEE